MRKFFVVTIILMSLLILFVLPLQAAAQKTDPESVLRSIFDALNAKDLDGALALVADDATITVEPNVARGKEEIRGWWENVVKDNTLSESSNFCVDGDNASWLAKVSIDPWRALGVAPLDFRCEGIVQNGLLTSYTVTMTDESQARLQTAQVLEANKILATRYMEELWQEGKLELADEFLSDDFVSYAFPAGGREAIKAAVTGFNTDLPNGYFLIDDMIVTEDKIVIRGSTVANAPPEGTEPERLEYWINAMSVKDGKITDRWLGLVPFEKE